MLVHVICEGCRFLIWLLIMRGTDSANNYETKNYCQWGLGYIETGIRSHWMTELHCSAVDMLRSRSGQFNVEARGQMRRSPEIWWNVETKTWQLVTWAAIFHSKHVKCVFGMHFEYSFWPVHWRFHLDMFMSDQRFVHYERIRILGSLGPFIGIFFGLILNFFY